MKLDPTFVYGNYFEACLWGGMGLLALVRRNCRWNWVLGGTLIVFGISDIIEARTGAWYSSAWLIAWKGICIVIIVASGLRVWAVRLRGNTVHRKDFLR